SLVQPPERAGIGVLVEEVVELTEPVRAVDRGQQGIRRQRTRCARIVEEAAHLVGDHDIRPLYPGEERVDLRRLVPAYGLRARAKDVEGPREDESAIQEEEEAHDRHLRHEVPPSRETNEAGADK